MNEMAKELSDNTSSSPGISIALMDGPVVINHADLTVENIQEVRGNCQVRAPMPAMRRALTARS
jgi:hypothetical protein